jgi:hypothetical protein
MWNAPIPSTTGELYTAARYNTDVVDNLLTLKESFADDGKIDSIGGLLRGPEFRGWYETLVPIAVSAGLLTLDFDNGVYFEATINANWTLATAHMPTSGVVAFQLVTKGNGTAYTAGWPAGISFSGGIPTITPTLNKYDFYTLVYHVAANKWFGFNNGQNLG